MDEDDPKIVKRHSTYHKYGVAPINRLYSADVSHITRVVNSNWRDPEEKAETGGYLNGDYL